jgi:hypothetical protein
MALTSKPSALLLLQYLGPPPSGRHNPSGLGPATLFVHPCPLDVELDNLDMLSVLFYFGRGFDHDGDFVNYINEY